MNIQASTILSFVTGRLYSTTPPTILFADLIFAATGKNYLSHELPSLKNALSSAILSQCPDEFRRVCEDWQHSIDWEDKVAAIDKKFGAFKIEKIKGMPEN